MFGFGKKDPAKKLEKQWEKLLKEARDLQRAGDIPAFAKKTAEAEAVRKALDTLLGEG